MQIFERAKSVRLRNQHGKFLMARKDQVKVSQDRDGTSECTVWQVEVLKGGQHIRLKSSFNTYLQASTASFILGATGRKVLQGRPYKLDRSVEWEPIMESSQSYKLKSFLETFLRANGGIYPYRNSVTHDIPVTFQDWVLWEVQVVESLPWSVSDVDGPEGLYTIPSPKGRLVYYSICDGNGKEVDNGDGVWPQLLFRGNSIAELTSRMKEAIDTKDDIILCTKGLSGALYPLRLALPPNNAPMHVLVVKAMSPAGKSLANKTGREEKKEEEDEEEEELDDEFEEMTSSDGQENTEEESSSGRPSSASCGNLSVSHDSSGRHP